MMMSLGRIVHLGFLFAVPSYMIYDYSKQTSTLTADLKQQNQVLVDNISIYDEREVLQQDQTVAVKEDLIKSNSTDDVDPDGDRVFPRNQTDPSGLHTVPPEIIISSQIPSEGRTTIPIDILVGKTLAEMDVEETILDIVNITMRDYNETHHTQITWKLFCFQNTTRDLLNAKLVGVTYSDRVTVHYDEKQLKPHFWNSYLQAHQIEKEVQYVWLCDGDMVLRDLAWREFWYLAHERLQPALFQPAIRFPNRNDALRKYQQIGVFQERCKIKALCNLAAVETAFIELGTPIFRMEAWKIVSNHLSKVYHPRKSDYGPDTVWCGILEKEYHQKKHLLARNPTAAQDLFRQVKGKNPMTEKPVPLSDYDGTPITCMVIHMTSILHRDTKTFRGKTTNQTAQERHQIRDTIVDNGKHDTAEFARLFRHYVVPHVSPNLYWRAFARASNE